MQKMKRKSFFETRFELLGWEIGKNDGQKNSSAYLPDLPSPPDENGLVKVIELKIMQGKNISCLGSIPIMFRVPRIG